MSDLISRQAAIAAIEEMQIPIMRSEFSDEQLIFTGMSEALAAIKELPSAQPEQRWIPCSERYPDMDERVLVYTVAHDYHVWDCMSNRADNYFWEDEEGLYHDKYEADLWMPLPEPWR